MRTRRRMIVTLGGLAAVACGAPAGKPRIHEAATPDAGPAPRQVPAEATQTPSPLQQPRCGNLPCYVIAEFTVYPDGMIEKHQLAVLGARSPLIVRDSPSGQSDYTVRMLGSEGGVLWQEFRTVSFRYDGPVKRDVDYSDIQSPYLLSARIPFFPDMKRFELVHDGRVVYAEALQ